MPAHATRQTSTTSRRPHRSITHTLAILLRWPSVTAALAWPSSCPEPDEPGGTTPLLLATAWLLTKGGEFCCRLRGPSSGRCEASPVPLMVSLGTFGRSGCSGLRGTVSIQLDLRSAEHGVDARQLISTGGNKVVQWSSAMPAEGSRNQVPGAIQLVEREWRGWDFKWAV